MKNVKTAVLAIVTCSILLTVATIPGIFANPSDVTETKTSPRVVDVSNNSFTERLSMVADSLSESSLFELSEDMTIHTGEISVSSIFPELSFDNDLLELSFSENNNDHSYEVSLRNEKIDDNGVEWEYIFDDDGVLLDIIAITDTGRISLKEAYDSIENCFFVTVSVTSLLVVAVAAVVVTAIVYSSTNSQNDNGSNSNGGNNVQPAYPKPINPDITVVSTTGYLGLALANEAVSYYVNGNIFTRLSIALKYSTARWGEITNGISSCEKDGLLLAVAVNGSKYSIKDLNRSDMGFNGKDNNEHYCAIKYNNKVSILPNKITLAQAQGIMRNADNKNGWFNTWTMYLEKAYAAADVFGTPVGPEMEKKMGYYAHFHVHDRLTGAHSFFGTPWVGS